MRLTVIATQGSMHVADSRLIVSARDVSGYLACPHLTHLDLQAARGGPKPPKFDDPGAEVLRRRGEEHETRILEGYRARHLNVVALTRPDWDEDGDRTWRRYADETLAAMGRGAFVIHQGCLFDGRLLGLPPGELTWIDRAGGMGSGLRRPHRGPNGRAELFRGRCPDDASRCHCTGAKPAGWPVAGLDQLLGVEVASPGSTTVEEIFRVFDELGLVRPTPDELGPLVAA